MRWGGGEYWYTHGCHWAGLAAFAVGLAASVATSNSPVFASPLAKHYLGGADLSFEAGLVVPALLYWGLVQRGRTVPLVSNADQDARSEYAG